MPKKSNPVARVFRPNLSAAALLVYASVILRLLRTSLTTVGREKLTDPGLLTLIIMASLLMSFIGYKVGHGKNWARIAFLIWTMWDLIAYPIFIRYGSATISYPIFVRYIPATLTFTMATILQLAVQLYVVIIIFSGESKQWFNNPKINQQQMSPAN